LLVDFLFEYEKGDADIFARIAFDVFT